MSAPERQAQYEEWAARMWDALYVVHPAGLTPRELQHAADLRPKQVLRAARFMRDLWKTDDNGPPVIYVRAPQRGEPDGRLVAAGNTWYIAPSWIDHIRPSIGAEYAQPALGRLESLDKLLAQTKRAFPAKVRRINKVQRNVQYLRDELNDLVEELKERR